MGRQLLSRMKDQRQWSGYLEMNERSLYVQANIFRLFVPSHLPLYQCLSILQPQRRPIKPGAHDACFTAVLSDGNRVGFSNYKLRYCPLSMSPV